MDARNNNDIIIYGVILTLVLFVINIIQNSGISFKDIVNGLIMYLFVASIYLIASFEILGWLWPESTKPVGIKEERTPNVSTRIKNTVRFITPKPPRFKFITPKPQRLRLKKDMPEKDPPQTV